MLAANQANLNETFAFDPAHNLLDQTGQAIKNNQVTVFEDKRYAYDNHGNLVDKKIAKHTHIQLEWNAAHQLIKTSTCRNVCHDKPTTQHTEYGYDAFGRRIFKRDEFGETRFVWDGNRLLSETRGAHTRTYVYNGGSFVPLAQLDHYAKPESEEKKADVYYFHTDHLGTPRELTDVRGEICWSASYKTWGNVLTEEWYQDQDEREAYGRSQALRFQGQYFDVETGLHYNRFRYYDPDIGRFVSQDPIGLLGGDNLYQYAANPTAWVDPLGLAPCALKPSGPLDWGGEDPQGLSRKDHVRRHGVDDPTRNVPHGVFNDNPINQTTDAWQRAKDLGLEPEVQGNR